MHSGLLQRIGALFGRKRFNDDLHEEMAFHREQRQSELVAEGTSVEEARQAANREFGNAERFEEASRDVFAFRIETVLQDLRFAIRQLRHNPVFAATIIFVLALGICAAVSIFSFVDAALIKPLPYAEPNRLVDVTESARPISNRTNLSYEDFKDWRRQQTVFSAFDIYNQTGYLMGTPSGVQPVRAARVTAGFFRTLASRRPWVATSTRAKMNPRRHVAYC